jgi:hypothetical protein
MRGCDHRVDLDSIQVSSDGVELTITIQCRKCGTWGTVLANTRDGDWGVDGEGERAWTANRLSGGGRIP